MELNESRVSTLKMGRNKPKKKCKSNAARLVEKCRKRSVHGGKEAVEAKFGDEFVVHGGLMNGS